MPMLNDLILINKADQAASKATVPSSHQLWQWEVTFIKEVTKKHGKA
jgi:hypothetical protein